MSAINVTSVQVLDNPQFFANPLQFEIQYECLQDLRHGAWRRRRRGARGRWMEEAEDDSWNFKNRGDADDARRDDARERMNARMHVED